MFLTNYEIKDSEEVDDVCEGNDVPFNYYSVIVCCYACIALALSSAKEYVLLPFYMFYIFSFR